MFHVPEIHRFRKAGHPYSTSASDGNNGLFFIDHYKISGYQFHIQASDGMGWEHVSVSLDAKHRKVDRCPTWEEMCYIKEMFWDSGDVVIQFHPAKKDYISMHPTCLHLWRSTEQEITTPETVLVGINPQK